MPIEGELCANMHTRAVEFKHYILLSFKIVDDTKDEKVKVGIVGQMLVYLIGKPTSPANIVGLANDLKMLVLKSTSVCITST